MSETIDDGRDDYRITDKAGPRVAGQLVGNRKTLRLTPDEADYELREGTIEKASAAKAVKASNAP